MRIEDFRTVEDEQRSPQSESVVLPAVSVQ